MNVRTKFEKFVALHVPEIIGGTQKIGQPMDRPTPTLPFFLKFLRSFCSDRSYECAYKICEVRSFIKSMMMMMMMML